MTTFVYIAASGDDLILVYTLDRAGRLSRLQDVSVSAGPSALAKGPNGQHLYCSLRASRELAAFHVGESGRLQFLNRRALDGDACYVAVDKSGRFLLAAYYSAAKVTVHRLGADGKIGDLVCNATTADKAHCIETDASNRYAFVPHPLDANCLFQFMFDEESGQLSPNPRSPRVEAAAGEGPRHFVFSADQRFVYTSNEDGSGVTAYHFDGHSGALRAFQTLSTLPQGFSGENTCAQIHLHPGGRWLYVSNRGHDSIAVFAVDADSGALASQEWQETEATPRVFNIDPSGRFLVAAGQATGRAATYSIDPDSGSLTPREVMAVGDRPMWVLFGQDSQ